MTDRLSHPTAQSWRVRRWRALDAARSGHFGELPALDDAPVLSVPIGERAGRLGVLGVSGVFGGGLGLVHDGVAVVADDEPTLPGVAALGVGAGGDAVEEFLHRQRVDVHLIERPLHVEDVDLVGRLGQVPGGGGHPAGHLLGRDGADGPLGVDEVRPDDQLLRLLVDHPVGRRAADALGAGDALQVGVDFVQLVVAPQRLVRGVGDDPQFPRPGHDRAGPALALVVEHRQVRVSAADDHRRVVGASGLSDFAGSSAETRAAATSPHASRSRNWSRQTRRGRRGVGRVFMGTSDMPRPLISRPARVTSRVASRRTGPSRTRRRRGAWRRPPCRCVRDRPPPPSARCSARRA